MEKMHTSILSAYLLAFIVSFPTAAFAVANGRNCNNPVFISYENAILTGSVEDVKIEADHVIDYEIERIKKDSGGYFLQGDRPDRKNYYENLYQLESAIAQLAQRLYQSLPWQVTLM